MGRTRRPAGTRLGLALAVLVTTGTAMITPASASAIPAGTGTGSLYCGATATGGAPLSPDAVLANVYACGPRPQGWPSYGLPFQYGGGFQCTELANRFLFNRWKLDPIFAKDLSGGTYVDYAHTTYPTIPAYANGTPGHPYLVGDIVSFTGGADGHVAVVKTSTYSAATGGNYTVTLLEQNASPTGISTATVTNWSMAAPVYVPSGTVSTETPKNFLALAAEAPAAASTVPAAPRSTAADSLNGKYRLRWSRRRPRRARSTTTSAGTVSTSRRRAAGQRGGTGRSPPPAPPS